MASCLSEKWKERSDLLVGSSCTLLSIGKSRAFHEVEFGSVSGHKQVYDGESKMTIAEITYILRTIQDFCGF